MIMFLKEKNILVCLIVILFLSFFPTSTHAQLTQTSIDSLVKELARSKEDTNKVTLLMTLGNEVGYTDQNKALLYGKEGYVLSTKINYVRGMGRTSYLIGTTYMELGNYTLTDSFLTIAEQKFNQLNDKKYLAIISNSRGSRNFMVGNYVLAADYYAKAAAGFDAINDTTLSMIAYQNLIAVVAQVKNYERAVELSKKILPLAVARKDSLQIGYTLQGLVTTLIDLEKYEEAVGYLKQLTDIANTTLDQNLAAESHSTIGTYYYRKNDFSRAVNHFEIAIKKAEILGSKYQLANHYNSLGQAYYRIRNFARAKDALIKGLSLAREHNNKRAESNVALSLSSLYDSTHEYSNAYKSLLLHTQLTDSILSSETRNYTSQLETLYETNKKENEILRLQKVQQEKDFEINRRNTYLGIGIGLITALIVILYLLKRNYRNKQKLSKQQSALLEVKIKTIEKEQQITSLQSMINGQETERTRIAKDLHDGLGGLFSTVKMHYSILQQDTPEIKSNILYKKTLDLINNASDELRKVAHNMMPEVLMKVGLVEALGDFCNNISSGKLLKVTLQAFGMDKRLSSSTEIMLYRIIQELVNNIIKHAYATEAIIQINLDNNRLSLTIEDNGKGFDTKEAEAKRSMGIATVKSRVDYLNGKLTIDSRKDIGTTVMIDLLLNES
jgi:two-component system, NarL family, sensor kinase